VVRGLWSRSRSLVNSLRGSGVSSSRWPIDEAFNILDGDLNAPVWTAVSQFSVGHKATYSVFAALEHDCDLSDIRHQWLDYRRAAKFRHHPLCHPLGKGFHKDVCW
jgi:hypothetical protein